MLVGPRGLTEKHTTFTRAEGMRAIAEAADQGLPTHELQHLTDELLEHADVIPLDDERHTTRDLLTHEQTLLDLAAHGRDAQSPSSHPSSSTNRSRTRLT